MKEKCFTIITILLCILTIGSLYHAGMSGVQFWISYEKVWKEDISEDDINALNKENKNLSKELSEKQKEYQVILQRKESFTSETSRDYEQEIRDCYIAKKEAESAARKLVLSRLEKASYISLSGTEQLDLGEEVFDKIIDEATGNAIVSAGVKSAIKAASEEMSLENIIDGAIEGAVAEVPNYITGEIQGAVTDVIGIDIFSINNWISEFMNADDTPVALANSIVVEQQQDVSRILCIINEDELTSKDMQYIAGLMERIGTRGEELIKAGSSSTGKFDGIEQLEDLAKQWEENNCRIIQYVNLEENRNEN